MMKTASVAGIGDGKDRTHSFPNEVGGWVMQKGFEDGHQGIFVLPQKTEGDLTSSSERPYIARISCCFPSISCGKAYHCIHRHQRRQPYCSLNGMELPQVSQTFDPA